MKKAFDDQTEVLDERLNELKIQLKTAYVAIQTANEKSAEHLTVSIESTIIDSLIAINLSKWWMVDKHIFHDHFKVYVKMKEDYQRAVEENSQLQQQVKVTNEDYRRRLWKYVQDIAVGYYLI